MRRGKSQVEPSRCVGGLVMMGGRKEQSQELSLVVSKPIRFVFVLLSEMENKLLLKRH